MKLVTPLPALFAVAALSACASLTPRSETPIAAWQSAATLGAAASCAVAALNRVNPARGPLQPAITHAVHVIDPGRVEEVTPQQSLMTAGEIYFVRLTALSPKGTRFELFSFPAWANALAAELKACG